MKAIDRRFMVIICIRTAFVIGGSLVYVFTYYLQCAIMCI